MKQEILKFNFRFESKDFFVSSKNAMAFDLIENWPNWNGQFAYVYGPHKCGKTSIAKIWQKKSNAKFIEGKSFLDLMSGYVSFEKINVRLFGWPNEFGFATQFGFALAYF